MSWSEVFRGGEVSVLSSTGGLLETNSYAIIKDFTLRALVDPYSPDILNELRVEKRLGYPEEIFVIFTHLHPDHVSLLRPLERDGKTRLLYLAHPEDLKFKTAYEELGRQMGLSVLYPHEILPISDKEWELLKNFGVEILHTPGHTPGSITIILREGPVEGAIVGDLLFKDGVGRWDLPGGDFYELTQSLKKFSRRVSEKAVIMPGHGPITTLERELRYNSYLLDIIGTGGDENESKSDWI